MKTILFSVLFLLVPKICISQVTENDKKILMDSLWKETTDVNYKYYRIIKDYNLEKESYKILDYYRNGVLQMDGMSKTRDDKSKIGEYNWYYENVNNKSTSNYKDGKIFGKHSEWYENGNKESTSNYKDGKAFGKEFEWYENGNIKEEGECTDEDFATGRSYKINQFWNPMNQQTIINGNGQYESNTKFYLDKGEYKNGFKNGVWTGISYQNNYTYTEEYNNGLMISGISIDSDGTRHEYYVMETKPNPKKGIQDFYNFIGKNFNYTRESIKNKIKGKIFINFIINKDGQIIEPKIVKGLGFGLDEEAIRVLLKYEDWIPGEQRGRKVRCSFSIPISVQ